LRHLLAKKVCASRSEEADMRRLACGLILLVVMISDPVLAHHPVATELPVGDGKVTDHPATGNVFACRTQFRTGGARHVGEWLHGDTWNPLEKPHVRGRLLWPDAVFALTEADDTLSVESNGLPVDQPTGSFPIARDDPAYAYDTNPNPIMAQSLAFDIPLAPIKATEPGCLPMGMTGFTLTGVAIYSAIDDAGLDAAAHEVQDLCNGHPQGKGQYHYHNSSPCLPGAESNAVIGWALDGYPILGMRDARNKLITNADLDVCHGRAEQVSVDGRTYAYAYRLTQEYPYTMGCFTGWVPAETRASIRQSMGLPRQRLADGRPPPRRRIPGSR
jgi:YHYH protein